MSPETKRSIRTAIQAAVGLGLALPAIVEAAGVAESIPWVAGAVAASAALARVMALPVVQKIIPGWLRVPAEPGTTSKTT